MLWLSVCMLANHFPVSLSVKLFTVVCKSGDKCGMGSDEGPSADQRLPFPAEQHQAVAPLKTSDVA